MAWGRVNRMSVVHRFGTLGAMHEPGRGKRTRRKHQPVEQRAIQPALRSAVLLARVQHRRTGEQQQQVTEATRQRAPLAPAQPHQPGPFQCPGAGGVVCVQREWNHQGEKDGRHRQAGIEGDGQLRAAAHPCGLADVEQREHQRGQCRAVVGVAQHAVLQHEGDRRQAEQQAGVDPRRAGGCSGVVADRRCVVARQPAGCALPGRHQQDGGEQQEVGDQERLTARVVLVAVLEHAPGGADDERAGKADQVEQLPVAVPRDQRDAQVEHKVVGEQRDMVAASAGHEQGRGEAAQRADHGQRACVLQHGQCGGERGHRDHADEHRQHREHTVETERDEQRQVEHGNRAPLQHLRVSSARVAQAPAQHQQGERGGADARQPELDRHVHMFARELGEEGQADEQNRDAQLDNRVAAEQPLPHLNERGMARTARLALGGFAARRRRSARRLAGSHVAPQRAHFSVGRFVAPERVARLTRIRRCAGSDHAGLLGAHSGARRFAKCRSRAG